MTTWLQDQAELEKLRDERDQAVEKFTKVAAYLANFVGDECMPCRYDHHGYCQEHGWFGEPGECGVREARELLGIAEGQSI